MARGEAFAYKADVSRYVWVAGLTFIFTTARLLVEIHLRAGILVAPLAIEVSLGRVLAIRQYGGSSVATTSKIIRELAAN